jgi:hypothetical protein
LERKNSEGGEVFSALIFSPKHVQQHHGRLFYMEPLIENQSIPKGFTRNTGYIEARCYDFENIFAEKFSAIYSTFENKLTYVE